MGSNSWWNVYFENANKQKKFRTIASAVSPQAILTLIHGSYDWIYRTLVYSWKIYDQPVDSVTHLCHKWIVFNSVKEKVLTNHKFIQNNTSQLIISS